MNGCYNSNLQQLIVVCFSGMRTPKTKKCAQKVIVTFFLYILHIKTKSNIVYEYIKKIFSRNSNILPQMHWKSNIFGCSAAIIGVFWLSLNDPILNYPYSLHSHPHFPLSPYSLPWFPISALQITKKKNTLQMANLFPSAQY